MSTWQWGFLAYLALAAAYFAWEVKRAPRRDQWRSSRDEAWERHADQAVAVGNSWLACGDRLATDLAAVMAPQLIDAAERILREETA